MRPNYKLIEAYCIKTIDVEALRECAPEMSGDMPSIMAELKNRFMSEMGWAIERGNNRQKVFADWLAGLPSVINIDYWNNDIIRLAQEWESLPINASERQEQKILDNWFMFMAMQYRKLAHRHGVELF
jgi:hypothetical protein